MPWALWEALFQTAGCGIHLCLHQKPTGWRVILPRAGADRGRYKAARDRCSDPGTCEETESVDRHRSDRRI